MSKNTENVKLTEISLQSEVYREYVFPDGSIYRIDSPDALLLKDGSTGHRVVASDGVVHYIPGLWIALRWKTKEGELPVAF